MANTVHPKQDQKVHTKLAARFKQFSEVATVHGVHKVANSTSRSRMTAWSILCLTLVGNAVYSISSTVEEYMSYPTLTDTKKETNNYMDFPSITICNANNYRLSALQSMSLSDTDIEQLLASYLQTSLQTKYVLPLSRSDVAMKYSSVLLNSTTIKTLSSSIESMKWNFVGWCKFSLSIKCESPEDFTDYFYHSNTGVCQTFNYDGKYRQIAPGAPFGLKLKLFTNEWDKVPQFSDGGAGIRIMIHPKEIYPNPFADSMLVPTGHLADIPIHKVVTKRLKSPFKTNCTNGEGQFLIYPGNYTVGNCQYSCFFKKAVEECGLIEPAYKFHKPRAFQESLKRFQENNKSKADLPSCFRHLKIDEDDCKCPPACYEEKYRTKISYLQWPTPANTPYYRSLMANFTGREKITDADVHENIVFLKIYFDELSYDVIAERAVHLWPRFFGTVGGQLGLWMGASAFSIIEFFLFIADAVLAMCRGKVRNEGNSNTSV